MSKVISCSRVSTEASDYKVLIPNKKGKRVRGKWFTPRELGFVMIPTSSLTKKHSKKGKTL